MPGNGYFISFTTDRDRMNEMHTTYNINRLIKGVEKNQKSDIQN